MKLVAWWVVASVAWAILLLVLAGAAFGRVPAECSLGGTVGGVAGPQPTAACQEALARLDRVPSLLREPLAYIALAIPLGGLTTWGGRRIHRRKVNTPDAWITTD